MRLLVLITFLLSTTVHAQNPEFCKIKAYLAKDIVESLNDGLEPDKINFAFPNVRDEQDAKEAMKFTEELMREVTELMKDEKDPSTISHKIFEACAIKEERI